MEIRLPAVRLKSSTKCKSKSMLCAWKSMSWNASWIRKPELSNVSLKWISGMTGKRVEEGQILRVNRPKVSSKSTFNGLMNRNQARLVEAWWLWMFEWRFCLKGRLDCSSHPWQCSKAPKQSFTTSWRPSNRLFPLPLLIALRLYQMGSKTRS